MQIQAIKQVVMVLDKEGGRSGNSICSCGGG